MNEHYCYILNYPAFCSRVSFLGMSVHDDQGHYEEANIHQDDHQHWCNERPHKVSVGIQPASAGGQESEH